MTRLAIQQDREALYPWRRLVGSRCRLTKRAGPSGATTL
jgi:hypothetical protein